MNQIPASGQKAESEKGAAPIEFSEIKAYTRVVDRLGIAAISGRNRTRLFEKLRPILRDPATNATVRAACMAISTSRQQVAKLLGSSVLRDR